MSGRGYGGGWWDWLTPFSLLTGASLLVGYALLGATWLLMKTGGATRDHARRMSLPLAIATMACIAAVSAATPYLDRVYAERWFAWPNVLLTAQVPLLVADRSFPVFPRARERSRAGTVPPRALPVRTLVHRARHQHLSRRIVPGRITIWEAASPAASQLFMLVGAGILIPIILAYTAYAYWVFRGKVGQEGYH